MNSAAGSERTAIIDAGAIAHNVRTVAEFVRPAKLMAAVKADGYGHGIVTAARAALAGGADWLGTAHLTEAQQLRADGIEAPILAWLHSRDTDFSAAIGEHIDLGVSGWELDKIAEAAQARQSPARVHLKIDTGLSRNGATIDIWPAVVAQAAQYQQQGLISVEGIFTHFAVADEPDRKETDEQLEVFHEALSIAEQHGVVPALRHAANSPAALTRPDTHFDMVRIGVSIYGQSPFADRTAESLGLKPAMELRTTLANVKKVPAEQGISYGLTYRVGAPTTLGLVPLGYGDGIPRIAVNAPVLIGGRRCYSAGRVAMDQFVVDLGADSDAQVGDEVTIFGGDSGISAAEWGAAAQSINYEIITRIGARVPRVVINEPEEGATDGE